MKSLASWTFRPSGRRLESLLGEPLGRTPTVGEVSELLCEGSLINRLLRSRPSGAVSWIRIPLHLKRRRLLVRALPPDNEVGGQVNLYYHLE